ncbi:hypothetical protein AN958_11492 [Leucoagaricus sp. SymC.cos]|nr:hypothetical protein AN958_11492 [Leucoagaricus sp. SymC.cos]
MEGPAGVGKSAIAQTSAERLKSSGHLGAAFFFSINHHDDHKVLFPTLAYQLSTTLPEYHSTLNAVILNDPTLLQTTMASQFDYLIVKPLQDLKRQGKETPRKAIFIDGLDQCESKDAQLEIIRIIAASVSEKTTPFRWAIFSRPESQIVAMFDRDAVSPLCRRLPLRISREADKEIEIYIQGELHEIIRRRGLPPSQFPADNDITEFVKVSNGLFVYPVTLLRFIGRMPLLQLNKALREILDTVSERRIRIRSDHQQPSFPLPGLDILYTVIMERIPKDVLRSAQLLLACFLSSGWGVAMLCNDLGFLESEFRGIVCEHLNSVVCFQEPQTPLELNTIISPTHLSSANKLFIDIHGQQLRDQSPLLDGIYGSVTFYHKSFYEFLSDPNRSSHFCVYALDVGGKYLDRLLEQHDHFGQSYESQDSNLVSPSHIGGSSASLSWSYGSEPVDAILKISSFNDVSALLFQNKQIHTNLLTNVDFAQRFKGLDYRKSLLASITCQKLCLRGRVLTFASCGLEEYSTIWPQEYAVIFGLLSTSDFDRFSPATFLETITNLEKFGVLRAYHPRLPSHFASAYQTVASKLKPRTRRDGLYKLGHGNKSVIWYWEFDMKKRYYRELWTVDFKKAVREDSWQNVQEWIDEVEDWMEARESKRIEERQVGLSKN